MGPVKPTNGPTITPGEFFRYIAPHSMMLPGLDFAQLFRISQDDGTREGEDGGKIVTKDVNGNPTELDGSQQMRRAHELDDDSSVLSVNGRPGSSGTTNHEMGHTHGDDTSGSTHNRKLRRNKRNSREKDQSYPDVKDKGYVGNVSNLDAILQYINNDISAEKAKSVSFQSVTQAKLPKKKERNKVRSANIVGGGVSDAQDTVDNQEISEMGISSSTEKLDANEEAQESSSEVCIAEAEPKNKKTTSELPKKEPPKTPKSHVATSNKSPANTKQEKPTNDETKTKNCEEDKTKVKNSKKGKSKPVKKDSQESQQMLRSPSPPVSHYLQFDDLDNAQEQWCTVVSKPQKKKRSQAQMSTVVPNCSTPLVPHQTRSKDLQMSASPYPVEPHRRNEHPNSLQQTASGNKPQCFPISPKSSHLEKRENNLNPKDFPVLNSSPRDYQRSLENVFDTGAQISDKDSDKESSKSFPADLSMIGRTACTISYASMASGAAAHGSVDSSKAASVTSSVEDSGLEFSSSSASLKWKGSPQERRHSIGSAPKELSKNVLQRTGSQEMLHCDKDLMSPSAAIPNKISNRTSKNMMSSDSTGSFTNSDADGDSVRSSEVGSEGIEDFTKSADDSTKSHSGPSGDGKKTSVHTEEKRLVVSAENENAKTLKTIPLDSGRDFQTTSNESNVISSGAKQVNNGRKKGVEFVYTGNKQYPPICGLQFGFFPGEEEVPVMSNSESAKPSAPNSGGKISQPIPDKSLSAHSSSLSPSSQQPFSTAATNSSSSVGDSIKAPKGPHIGLNGFVLTDQTQIKSTSPDSQCSESSSSVSPEALETKSEPKDDDSQDSTRKCAHEQELKVKSSKKPVYIRPQQQTATRPISHEHYLSFSFLGAEWEWNDVCWVKKSVEDNPDQ